MTSSIGPINYFYPYPTFVNTDFTYPLSDRRLLFSPAEKETAMTSISLIAAMDCNRCIGKGNTIPWKLSSDMKRFKMLTVGKPCIMGHKTFASMKYRPLVNRGNIVLTSNSRNVTAHHNTYLPYEVVEHPVAAKIKAMHSYPNREIMVIGGTAVYQEYMKQATRMYLTFVDMEVEGGDTFFPEWNKDEWREVYSESFDPFYIEQGSSTDQPGYTFKIYDRITRPLPMPTP